MYCTALLYSPALISVHQKKISSIFTGPKYFSLITSRTSEILTLGENSSASLGSEAIFVKTVEKSKNDKYSNPKK